MPIDCTIRAGTNRPIKFTFPSGFDTAGKVFELVAQWNGGRKVYASGTGLAVTGTLEVTWTYSLTDSREFPIGKLATLELQWTAAGIQDSDTGMLTVTPGISND